MASPVRHTRYNENMELDRTPCYRALRTRDARFDGRFFTAVRTTGIYCRPVCPARTPRRANCVFFACAAAAEAAGFRACRRCRPEVAPGTPAWLGTAATVARALRMIEDGALDHAGVPELAARLGVGARHLRRLFVEQLGAPPLRVAQTRRAHVAKRLIETTELGVTEVALAAGFDNPRALHRAMKASFATSPTALRRGAARTKTARIELRLGYRPPLDWEAMQGFLRPRAIPGVEQVEGGVYRRVAAWGEGEDEVGVVEVRKDARKDALVLSAPGEAGAGLATLAARAEALFDLGADPAAIFAERPGPAILSDLAARYPGTRVPGAWDRFEVAVRTVLGQQVTVKGATTLAGRLVARFGRPLARPEGALTHRFPRPDTLVDAPLEQIGLPGQRARTIRTLARAVAEGEPVLELAPDLETAVERLRALPGVGDWTAHYLAMRALREPDAFCASDLALRKAVGGEGGPAKPRAVEAAAEAWRPWRAYAAMLLWRAA